MHAAAVVDAVCYGSSSDMSKLQDGTFTTEGTPATYPYPGDADLSIQRKPFSTTGNGQDTDQNLADFSVQAAANPRNSASTPTP
jgi:hypothetical protein